MTDENEEVTPHVHVYDWGRDGNDSVNKCACGSEQARLKNAYSDNE